MRINNDYRKTIRHAKWVQKLGLARGFAVISGIAGSIIEGKNIKAFWG